MKLKKNLSVRTVVVISSILALLLCVTGITIAYIIDKTESLTNTFKPSQVSCQVVEKTWENGGTVKENVQILNTGDTSAYIRSAIVVTWQNEKGEVYSKAPVLESDYTISINTDDWELGSDGYYYHRNAVNSGSFTNILINSCTVTGTAPADGYTLSVEILANAIQSEPDSAVNDAWGASVDQSNVLTPAGNN